MGTTFVGSNLDCFVLPQATIATSILAITVRHSLFPASFTRTIIVGNYFLPTPRKKKENDTGLPSSASNTEWVSVHLYPERIFVLIYQKPTTLGE